MPTALRISARAAAADVSSNYVERGESSRPATASADVFINNVEEGVLKAKAGPKKVRL